MGTSGLQDCCCEVRCRYRWDSALFCLRLSCPSVDSFSSRTSRNLSQTLKWSLITAQETSAAIPLGALTTNISRSFSILKATCLWVKNPGCLNRPIGEKGFRCSQNLWFSLGFSLSDPWPRTDGPFWGSKARIAYGWRRSERRFSQCWISSERWGVFFLNDWHVYEFFPGIKWR